MLDVNQALPDDIMIVFSFFLYFCTEFSRFSFSLLKRQTFWRAQNTMRWQFWITLMKWTNFAVVFALQQELKNDSLGIHEAFLLFLFNFLDRKWTRTCTILCDYRIVNRELIFSMMFEWIWVSTVFSIWLIEVCVVNGADGGRWHSEHVIRHYDPPVQVDLMSQLIILLSMLLVKNWHPGIGNTLETEDSRQYTVKACSLQRMVRIKLVSKTIKHGAVP